MISLGMLTLHLIEHIWFLTVHSELQSLINLLDMHAKDDKQKLL